MSSSRRLRAEKQVNYREVNDVCLPRAERAHNTTCNGLFPVCVLEKEDTHVKIHYVGYLSVHNEWREESELESLEASEASHSEGRSCGRSSFYPFSLSKNLMIKIKQLLSCSRRSSPTLKIVVPFDAIQFNGGLKLLGTPSKKVQGIQRYTIKHYQDVNPLFGRNWHYRSLNPNEDCGYVVLEL